MIGKVLGFIFKRSLKKSLINDKELQEMLEDGDKSLKRLKENVDSLEKNGIKVPKELKKYI
tara:strand:- start:93 stop:275 length:183 start_codon:yes stop_codon:yes gene_type:complete